MFLLPNYFWLESVLIGAAIVFVIDLLGNIIAFGNRVTNLAEHDRNEPFITDDAKRLIVDIDAVTASWMVALFGQGVLCG